MPVMPSALSTVLVTGATGTVGRHVVAELARAGVPVCSASRATGVDLSRPETVEPAVTGASAVFLLWPFLSLDGLPDLLARIARHARRIVYLSAASPFHAAVEQAIEATGLEWVFLRPTARRSVPASSWSPPTPATPPRSQRWPGRSPPVTARSTCCS